jgi:hypothetical protein
VTVFAHHSFISTLERRRRVSGCALQTTGWEKVLPARENSPSDAVEMLSTTAPCPHLAFLSALFHLGPSGWGIACDRSNSGTEGAGALAASA